MSIKSTVGSTDSRWVAGRLFTSKDAKGQRGASLVEYALALALVLLLTVAALSALTSSSGTFLSQTGEDIGKPPQHVADLEPSLPDAPSWIGNP